MHKDNVIKQRNLRNVVATSAGSFINWFYKVATELTRSTEVHLLFAKSNNVCKSMCLNCTLFKKKLSLVFFIFLNNSGRKVIKVNWCAKFQKKVVIWKKKTAFLSFNATNQPLPLAVIRIQSAGSFLNYSCRIWDFNFIDISRESFIWRLVVLLDESLPMNLERTCLP